MSLQPEDIQKLGQLARLRIEPRKLPDLIAKLSGILDFVDQLKLAETEAVLPMAHPLDRTQRLRSDTVTETDQHALYQQNAAQVERSLYLVPKVIE